ncbi:MAG: MlaD family protein [Acidimicrobiales bacterium]
MTTTAVKFGVFVAICASFTIWLAFVIGNIELTDPFGRNNFDLIATFDDASGLLVNDSVKISGVPVGKVTGIEVTEGEARVTLQVSNDYRDRLPSDTSAAIRWRNLIGQRYLYLYPGDASTMLTDGDEIGETESVVNLGELFNRLGPIVSSIDESQVNQFIQAVSDALQGNEDSLGQTLHDLATLSTGLASRDEAISRLLENLNTVTGTITTRDQQIRTLLDNLLSLAETFSANTDVLDQSLTELGGLSVDLSTLVTNSSDEITNIITYLDRLIADQVIPRVESGSLASALQNFDEAARAIFNAGRIGEWLNQDIVCAQFEAPPCVVPQVVPTSQEQLDAATAGTRSASFEAGVETVTTLMVGRLPAMAGASAGSAGSAG